MYKRMYIHTYVYVCMVHAYIPTCKSMHVCTQYIDSNYHEYEIIRGLLSLLIYRNKNTHTYMYAHIITKYIILACIHMCKWYTCPPIHAKCTTVYHSLSKHPSSRID